MEFDELKKVWDEQNARPMFTLDEKALHNRILEKKVLADRTANFTEWVVIVAYLAAGTLVLVMNIWNDTGNVWMYTLSVAMYVVAVKVALSRRSRLKETVVFDRSMSGDLNYAIGVATYQLKLSQWMRWALIPLCILISGGLLQTNTSLVFVIGTVAFLALTYFASGWEHKYYKARKKELEELQSRLGGE